jgi:hypothetical protein
LAFSAGNTPCILTNLYWVIFFKLRLNRDVKFKKPPAIIHVLILWLSNYFSPVPFALGVDDNDYEISARVIMRCVYFE